MTWSPPNSTILEVLPPTLKSGLEGLHRRLARVRKLAENGHFDAVNIPEIHDEENRNPRGMRVREYSPRLAPRELGRRIQDQLGIPVIINHVVSFQGPGELLEWAHETIQGHGISNIVLVGAPHDRKEWPGPPVSQANRILQENFSGEGIQIGNICIPQREGSPVSEAHRMEEKALNGANFFTTQIVFEADSVRILRDELQQDAPHARNTPILVSLCPVKRVQQLGFLRYLGVRVPDSLEAYLSTVPEGECLDLSLEVLGDLQAQLIEQHPTEATPLGWNIAPVGPIPVEAVASLMDRLPGSTRA